MFERGDARAFSGACVMPPRRRWPLLAAGDHKAAANLQNGGLQLSMQWPGEQPADAADASQRLDAGRAGAERGVERRRCRLQHCPRGCCCRLPDALPACWRGEQPRWRQAGRAELPLRPCLGSGCQGRWEALRQAACAPCKLVKKGAVQASGKVRGLPSSVRSRPGSGSGSNQQLCDRVRRSQKAAAA